MDPIPLNTSSISFITDSWVRAFGVSTIGVGRVATGWCSGIVLLSRIGTILAFPVIGVDTRTAVMSCIDSYFVGRVSCWQQGSYRIYSSALRSIDIVLG